MKLTTKRIEDLEDRSRFEAFYNGKRQGVVVGIKDPARGFKHWLVEGDVYNKIYPDSDEATLTCAEKNGRKIKDKAKKR